MVLLLASSFDLVHNLFCFLKNPMLFCFLLLTVETHVFSELGKSIGSRNLSCCFHSLRTRRKKGSETAPFKQCISARIGLLLPYRHLFDYFLLPFFLVVSIRKNTYTFPTIAIYREVSFYETWPRMTFVTLYGTWNFLCLLP